MSQDQTQAIQDALADIAQDKIESSPLAALQACLVLFDSTELSDDPNSPNYRYKDTGYMAGSRKEAAAAMIRLAAKKGSRLRATDIDFGAIEENPREAELLIKKSNLFGKIDWDDLSSDGMSSEAGYLIDRLYATVAAKPTESTPEARKSYALGLETLRDRCEKCLTVHDVLDQVKEIYNERNGLMVTESQSEELDKLSNLKTKYRSLLSVHLSRLTPYLKGISTAASAMDDLTLYQLDNDLPDDAPLPELIRGEGPEGQTIAQAMEVENQQVDQYRQLLDSYFSENPDVRFEFPTKSTMVNPSLVVRLLQGTELGKNEIQVKQAYQDLDAEIRNAHKQNPLYRAWGELGDRFLQALRWNYASTAFRAHVIHARSGTNKSAHWEWANLEGERKTKGMTKQQERFFLKVTDKFERVGGRAVAIESTSQLKDLIGFKEVQSGNWVLKDVASAKFHVEQTAGAMMDMSDILGIDVAHLGLGGRLGMAFGARGHGLSGARAHYEPVHRVINLTKMGGGGALAHEWVHSIDNILSEIMGSGPSGIDKYASESPELLPKGELRDAMASLRSAMIGGTVRQNETFNIKGQYRSAKYNFVDRNNPRFAKEIINAKSAEEAVLIIDSYMKPNGEKPKPRLVKSWKQWRTLAAALHSPQDAETVSLKTGPRVSDFYALAVDLDGGQVGKYWSSIREMFARAFQSYVEDKLKGMGRRNDYLSALADNTTYGQGVKPYPEGSEREKINMAFDLFFEHMASANVLGKAAENKDLLDAIFGPMD